MKSRRLRPITHMDAPLVDLSLTTGSNEAATLPGSFNDNGKRLKCRLRPIKGRELRALKHIMLDAIGVSDMGTAIWANEYGPRLVRQLEREREKNQSLRRRLSKAEKKIKRLKEK